MRTHRGRRSSTAQQKNAASLATIQTAVFVDRHRYLLGPANLRAPCSAKSRSGTSLESIVRASVSAETEAAPAERTALAHSLSVVPVVKTSSMSRTRRPANGSALRTLNARRRFRRRSCRVRDVCGSVATVRTRPVVDTGRIRYLPRRSAISRDWLNSRARSLEGCSGTGTIRSASSCSGKARIINAAKGLASPNAFRYLSAQIASWRGGIYGYSVHARSYAGGRSRQGWQRWAGDQVFAAFEAKG